MKLLFVVNPVSGGVNKGPFLLEAKKLCSKYGIEARFFKTTGHKDEQALLLALQEFHPDKVAAAGGDGTTLFTAITLLNTGYPMGIIPLGSANGMAAELFVNPRPIEALKDLIMSELVAGLDMVVVNDEHYTMHIGDVGINARIVHAYSKDKNRGMATYAKYFIDELKRLEPFGMTIRIDGKVRREKGLMLGICNSRKYGTGVPLTLTGNPMDGKFEIVIVEKIDLTSLIKAGLSKFDERFHNSQSGKVFSTDKAEIEFDRPRLLQLDGEVIGKFKQLKVGLLKQAVKLITHGENRYL
ncbi:MAG: hypothetical protein L3J66_12365 [Bacteroidales bacterium]|nr:hypothetical protein [Bacteroidales bacterium]